MQVDWTIMGWLGFILLAMAVIPAIAVGQYFSSDRQRMFVQRCILLFGPPGVILTILDLFFGGNYP